VCLDSDYRYADHTKALDFSEQKIFDPAAEADNPKIGERVRKALQEHGVEAPEEIKEPKGFVDLLMDFIKICLPDLTWAFTDEDIPSLNAYWGKLNVQFGYGCFSN
jgi:hypothetical protein